MRMLLHTAERDAIADALDYAAHFARPFFVVADTLAQTFRASMFRPAPESTAYPTVKANPDGTVDLFDYPEPLTLTTSQRALMLPAARHWARHHQITYYVTRIADRFVLTAHPDQGALILLTVTQDGTVTPH